MGLATLWSLGLSIFVVAKMGQFREKHRSRIRRFTIFFLCSSIAMVLLVALVVVLFASNANSESYFLWIEGLQISLLVLVSEKVFPPLFFSLLD